MLNEVLNDARTEQELMERGRKAEALRITRLVLTRRFGGLDHARSQALETQDVAALEAIVLDSTLTLEHLRARLDHHPEATSSPRGAGIRGQDGKPQRLSPLGGARSS